MQVLIFLPSDEYSRYINVTTNVFGKRYILSSSWFWRGL